MARTTRREKGTGTIYRRANGTWTGVVDIGTSSDGKRHTKTFSGKTEAEVKRKIREFNQSGERAPADTVTVETYVMNWLTMFKRPELKVSSYDTLEGTVKRYILGTIGYMKLRDVTDTDIQKLLLAMYDEGKSYSTIKKVYDCLNSVMNHATIKQDIIRNPMLTVKMIARDNFAQKEMRVFSENEVRLITEECHRHYKTGTPVYAYADVYVLMLNTGLRMGEAIGLKPGDWDEDANTLHVARNIQRVLVRDRHGNATGGYGLATNTTKTYSGDRIIPLNKNATEAIRRLLAAHPNSEYLVCNRNGKLVPPEHIERTFYRILKSCGIAKTGTHTIRHTFASHLFNLGADAKVVSELLGHASIQITLNTYIHLIKHADHEAVSLLDGIF